MGRQKTHGKADGCECQVLGRHSQGDRGQARRRGDSAAPQWATRGPGRRGHAPPQGWCTLQETGHGRRQKVSQEQSEEQRL